MSHSTERKLKWVLLTFSVCLVACGNKGSAPDSGLPDSGPNGSLDIAVSAPAVGVAPTVDVAGPFGFSQTLHSTADLSVPPGDYSVVAQTLIAMDPIVGAAYLPTIIGTPAAVSAGATASVSVAYAPQPLPGSGTLWIPDSSNLTIWGTPATALYLDAGPSLQTAMSIPLGGHPQGLAFDQNGVMWVATNSAPRVWGIDLYADGGFAVVAVLTPPGANQPAGIAFAPNGDLWVTDYGQDELYRYSAAQIAAVLAGAGATASPLIVPAALTDAGLVTLRNPEALVFDSPTSFWVSNQGNATLVKFQLLPDGGFPTLSDGGALPLPAATIIDDGGVMQSPFQMALDSTGQLWVSDVAKQQVFRFSPAGRTGTTSLGPTTVFANLDGGLPYLSQIFGISFDASGDMWLTDQLSHTLVQIPVQPNLQGTIQPTPLKTFSTPSSSTLIGIKFDPPKAGLFLYP